MRNILLAATLLAASPALALQTPVPGKADPRVCDVKYDPNDVTDVTAMTGDTMTILFGAKERIAYVTSSDHEHLHVVAAKDSNILWLRSKHAMRPQPISIRTLKEDGSTRDYSLQWTALPDPTKQQQMVASASSAPAPVVEEVKPETSPNLCYMIRYEYGVEVTAAQAAAWRARVAKERAEAAEIALRKDEQARWHNLHYTGQGDASIGPTQIYDDGYTTTMVFPGNMRVPTIFKRTPEGTDAEVTGTTTEQGGVIKIHEVLPFIRLRDGDLVLCLTNHNFNQIGLNPGTGTNSDNISRDVATPR